MNIDRWWNATQLLLRIMASGTRYASESVRFTTAQGTEYELYPLVGVPRRTILLVYGMTIAGEKETRLVHFAHSLASSGFQVIIPRLPGLKAYSFDHQDMERLADLIACLGNANRGRLGIIGFSAGASMSLVVASRPELTGLVDLLLLLSPYASLQDAWIRFQSQTTDEPVAPANWDHFIWCMCVLAYIDRDQIGLTNQEQSKLEHLLADYCTGITFKEKRAFYFNVLRGRKIGNRVMKKFDSGIWTVFSPPGKLGSLKGRVMILHDPHDPWAPPKDSEAIITELCKRNQPDAQRLLVTPLISHVSPHYFLKLNDIFRVVDMFGELFA